MDEIYGLPWMYISWSTDLSDRVGAGTLGNGADRSAWARYSGVRASEPAARAAYHRVRRQSWSIWRLRIFRRQPGSCRRCFCDEAPGLQHARYILYGQLR